MFNGKVAPDSHSATVDWLTLSFVAKTTCVYPRAIRISFSPFTPWELRSSHWPKGHRPAAASAELCAGFALRHIPDTGCGQRTPLSHW